MITVPGVRLVLGVLDIDILEDGHTPRHGRTTDESAGALNRWAEARQFYPERAPFACLDGAVHEGLLALGRSGAPVPFMRRCR